MYSEELLENSPSQLTQKEFEGLLMKFRDRFRLFLIMEIVVSLIMLSLLWILMKISEKAAANSDPEREAILFHEDMKFMIFASVLLLLPLSLAFLATKFQSRCLTWFYIVYSGLITLFWIVLAFCTTFFFGIFCTICTVYKIIGVYIAYKYISILGKRRSLPSSR